MRTTIDRKYWFQSDSGDFSENSISLEKFVIVNNNKNTSFNEVGINRHNPIVIRLKAKKIPPFYRLDKITFPLTYIYGSLGFSLTVLQGEFDFDDSVETINTAINGTVNVIDYVTVPALNERNSEGREVELDLSTLSFTYENGDYTATFAIINTYSEGLTNTENTLMFDIQNGFKEKMVGNEVIFVPEVNIELIDTRCSDSIKTIKDGVYLNLATGQLLLNNNIYSVETNKYVHSISDKIIIPKTNANEFLVDENQSEYYKFNDNIVLLEDITRRIYNYEFSNKIIITSSNNYPMYFDLLKNNEQTQKIFEKFSLNDKTYCGYSVKENLCVYFEDNCYIVKDSNGNKIYLSKDGFVLVRMDSLGNYIRNFYDIDDNGKIILNKITHNTKNEDGSFLEEVIAQGCDNKSLFSKGHIINNNIYVEVVKNISESESVYNYLYRNEQNELLNQINVIIINGEQKSLTLENVKNQSKTIISFVDNKVYSVIEKIKNQEDVYTEISNKYYLYKDQYVLEFNEQTKEEIYYFYDKNKNIHEIKNDKEVSIFSSYNEYGICVDKTTVVRPLKKLIKDDTEDQLSSYWVGNVELEEDGLFDKCYKVNPQQFVYQDVQLYGNDTFKIEGFIKHNSSASLSNSAIVLEIGYYLQDDQYPRIHSQYLGFTPDNTKDDWYYFETNEITLPENAFDVMARLHISAEEELRFEKINVVTKNKRADNIITNELFENFNNSNNGGYIVDNLSSERHSISVIEDSTLMKSKLYNTALKLSGCDRTVDLPIAIYQEINLVGKKNEVYLVEAYIKNLKNNVDKSQLFVEYKIDNQAEKHIFEIENNNNDYQRVYGVVKAKFDFTSVKVGYEYYGNTDLYISQLKFMKINNFNVSSYDNKKQRALLTNKYQQINIFKDDKITKQMSTNGSYVEYKYDEYNRIVKERNIHGHTKEYTYDILSRMLEISNKKGTDLISKHTNTYTDFVNTFKDEFNNETTYFLNDRNEVERILYPNNLKTYKSTNSLRLVDEYGVSNNVNGLYIDDKYIEYSYDNNHNLTLIEHKNGSKYSYTLTPSGQVLKVLKDNEVLEEYTYTQDLKLETITTPINKIKYIYDDKGKVVEMVLFKPNETTSNDITYIAYDEQGKIVLITRPYSNELVAYKYDASERLIEEKNLKDNETIRYEYDTNDDVKVTYINNGQCKEITHKKVLVDNNNNKDINVIDNLLTRSKDVFFYDKFDEGVFGTKNISGNLTYSYESTLRTNVLTSYLRSHVYEYDLLTFCEDLNYSVSNIYIKNKHELLNELATDKTFSLWIKPTGTYDKTGVFTLTNDGQTNVDACIESTGKLSLYINDNKKIETDTNVSLNVWNYISLSIIKYGADDSRIDYFIMLNDEIKHYQDELDFPLGTSTILKIGRDLNDPNPDLSLDLTQGNNRTMPYNIAYLSISAYPHTEETLQSEYECTRKQFFDKANSYYCKTSINQDSNNYDYVTNIDTLGRITKKQFIKNDTNVFTKTYEYVKSRLLAERTSTESIIYTYNSMGNITRKKDQLYEYDLLGRLTKETTNNVVTSYEYDDNGNLTKMITDNIVKTYSYNKDVLQSYTTTDNGEINTTTLEYSNNNFYPTKIGNNNLTWDKGRLTSYNNTTFEYNVYGQRTKKTVGTKVYTYTLDNTNIIKEHILDTTNNIDVTLEYIYDQSNQLVGVVEGNNVYYYDKDATNEIKGLVDTNGNYVVKYTYTAYGEVEKDILVNTNISTYNPFMYKGYYYDVETQLYWVSSRYYSPELCRWISPDSIEYLDPESINGLNLYAYCFNDPINYADPSGCFPVLAVILCGIALVGMGLTIGGVASDNNTLTAIGLGMVGAAALVSGGIALAGAIATGATLTGIIGGVTATAGLGSLGFMSAEIQEATGNGNWIMDTTGMSDGLYNTLLLSTAAIATLGTAASSVSSAFNIKSINGFGKYGDYYGMKFQTGAGKTRVLSFHNHGHKVAKGIKSIGEWHWQLQKWNPIGNKTSGTIAKWLWWSLTRI